MAQNSCATVPNNLVAGIVNDELREQNPILHINQVDRERMEQKKKDIFLPGDSWIKLENQANQVDRERMEQKKKDIFLPGDSWIKLENQAPHPILQDLEPVNRPRRSHYIFDLNSNGWKISPAEDGLRLRINFETDENEIKGWCRKCKIKRRRDRAAADANILPRSSEFPFVEVTLAVSYIDGNAHLGLRSLEDVNVDMRLDGNGLLELFEGRIEKMLRDIFQEEIYQAWGSISGVLEPQISAALAQEIEIFGTRTRLTEARFHGNDATICME